MLGKEEFKEKIDTVVNHIKANDVDSATAEILKVIDDYNQGVEEFEELSTKNTTLSTQIEDLTTKVNKLKDTNLEMLLKVGSPTGGNNPASNINNGADQKPARRRFEDLFNEKGELK